MAWALGELFQSTPPARGATGILESFIGLVGFNPRPPRGGRLVSVRKCWHSEIVSIHAPRAGGDWAAFVPTYFSSEFQSTPPARGATRPRPTPAPRTSVSIHAPRAGGDPSVKPGHWLNAVSIHAPRAGGVD